jgi:hypothetical protein
VNVVLDERMKEVAGIVVTFVNSRVKNVFGAVQSYLDEYHVRTRFPPLLDTVPRIVLHPWIAIEVEIA